MGKLTTPDHDYVAMSNLINKLRDSTKDNPNAQKLVRQLEKKCDKHFSNPQAPEAEKSRNKYAIVGLLLQLERFAESHWAQIKELFS